MVNIYRNVYWTLYQIQLFETFKQNAFFHLHKNSIFEKNKKLYEKILH